MDGTIEWNPLQIFYLIHLDDRNYFFFDCGPELTASRKRVTSHLGG